MFSDRVEEASGESDKNLKTLRMIFQCERLS